MTDGTTIDFILNLILIIASTVIPVAIAFAVKRWNDFAGDHHALAAFQIGKAAEEKIKAAALTGLTDFMARKGVEFDDESAVEFAIGHVLGEGAADSVKAIGASRDALSRVVRGKLPEAKALLSVG